MEGLWAEHPQPAHQQPPRNAQSSQLYLQLGKGLSSELNILSHRELQISACSYGGSYSQFLQVESLVDDGHFHHTYLPCTVGDGNNERRTTWSSRMTLTGRVPCSTSGGGPAAAPAFPTPLNFLDKLSWGAAGLALSLEVSGLGPGTGSGGSAAGLEAQIPMQLH